MAVARHLKVKLNPELDFKPQKDVPGFDIPSDFCLQVEDFLRDKCCKKESKKDQKRAETVDPQKLIIAKHKTSPPLVKQL